MNMESSLKLIFTITVSVVCFTSAAQDLPCDLFQGNYCQQSGCETTAPPCQHSACGSDSTRYKSPIFDSLEIQRCTELYVTVSDSANPATDSNAVDLYMDVYYNPNDCQCCHRPAILLGASGGFYTQDRRNALMVDLGYDYAQRGYMVFTYDYRTGFYDCCNPDSLLAWACRYSGDPVQIENAVYKAQQDVTTAIVYLKANAARFGIDPDQIIVGGMSAGAVNALNVAYLDQFEGPGRKRKDLGMLNKYAIPGYDYTTSGVIAMWGSLLEIDALPKNETGQPEDQPAIFFHGTCDGSLPFDRGKFDCYFHPDSSDFVIYGPNSIEEAAVENNLPMCVEVHAACGFAHGIHNYCKGETSFNTKYLRQITRYMTHHSAKFVYNNVLKCESGCNTQNRYICKPCYCKTCNNDANNFNPPGCRNCKDKGLYPNDEVPSYLENCDGENQEKPWINCYKFAKASDPQCAYSLGPSSIQTIFSNLTLKHNQPTGELKLEWISAIESSFKMELFDVLGKQHRYRLIEFTKGRNTSIVNLAGLQKGVYFISLRNGNLQQGYKFFH